MQVRKVRQNHEVTEEHKRCHTTPDKVPAPFHNPFRSALSFNTSKQSPLPWSGTGTASSGPNGLR
ncbi:MAG: hypothetical protein ACK56F_31735, partial [bacterium]